MANPLDASTPSRSHTSLLWRLFPLGLLPLLAACGDETPRSIFDTNADAAEISAWMYNYIFWITVVVMVIVGAIFTYAVFRFRERPDDDGTLPEQVHGNLTAEIAWTIVPAIIVVAIMVPTVQNIYALDAAPALDKAVSIQVIGKQWWWEYDYRTFTGQDTDGHNTYKLDFTTANELHVPANTPIALELTSADVIHAFWVPRLFGKRDATPGRAYPIYFTSPDPGGYIGQCAELCGESHALMGIKIFVHPTEGPDSYARWAENQRKPAEPPTAPLAIQGQQLFIDKGCVACHSIRGHERTTMNPVARSRTTGPELTHVGERTTIAALTLPNTLDNLTRWIHKPAEIKGGAIMANPKFNPTEVTEEEARAIATYLIRLK